MESVIIRTALREDFPALMDIWHVCFGDGEKALKHIFSRLLKPENMLVLTVDNEPAATLSVQPFTLASGQNERAAAYIYGVATRPEHEGKGYSTALLERAHSLCAERGAVCSVLVPAQKSLFRFYQKRGYETAFRLNRASVMVDGLPGGDIPELRPATAGELMRARLEQLGGGLFARWDEEYLSFIVEDSIFWGGGTFRFEYEGKLCCAVCYKSGDILYVKELAAPDAAIDALLRALRVKFAAKGFVMYLREDVQTSYTNNLLPFAMVQWYDNKMKSGTSQSGGPPAYIAHVLD